MKPSEVWLRYQAFTALFPPPRCGRCQLTRAHRHVVGYFDFWICAGFRMPAIDSRATFTGGRRPKAAKERTRGDSAERLPRTPLWGFESRAKCEGWCAE